jgi:hypothetical protein
MCGRAQPGVRSGRAWPSMYWLMIDCGAPARETAKWDGELTWPRMRARTQAPVYSHGTLWAVRSLRRWARTEIAGVGG